MAARTARDRHLRSVDPARKCASPNLGGAAGLTDDLERETGPMYRGVLINESLIGTSILDVLRVLDTEIVEMSAPAAGQPTTWTLHSFEVGDVDAAAAAQLLADQLMDGPWYVDFNNGEWSYVVFSSCVFTYVRGDEVKLNAARAHAHQQGIPKSQIDWAVPV